MADGKTFTYSIVTPESATLDLSAEEIVVPAHDGQLGILANHAPLIAKLSDGEMKVVSGGKTELYHIKGGFLEIRNNAVSIITTESSAVET